jgi:hypothetical protein
MTSTHDGEQQGQTIEENMGQEVLVLSFLENSTCHTICLAMLTKL